MADVIQMTGRRSARMAPGPSDDGSATLFFDLSSPQTYLLAERIERRLGAAWWRPAVLWSNGSREGEDDVAALMEAAERRARELRMPLVWPERFPAPVPKTMRVASFAAERGRGPAFAIAAGRLAFCGGFDIEDLDMLAEAAAAAGLEVAEALTAAKDIQRDEAIVGAGRALWTEGVELLPALRHDGRMYCGELQIAAALAGQVAAHPNAS